jgi:hypothetical protein
LLYPPVLTILWGNVDRIRSKIWFSVGQRWLNNDAIHGRFLGEVIETSAQGECGTVVITDDQGKVLDTYIGPAAAFQASGEWQLAEE